MIKQIEYTAKNNHKERFISKIKDYQELIRILNDKNLSNSTVEELNTNIDEVNMALENDDLSNRELNKNLNASLSLIEIAHGYVVKKHFQNKWMLIGMSGLGIPFGLLFGIFTDNMAFFAIGIPVGMAIGVAVGSKKDKEAVLNGQQLDIEIKP